MKAEKTRQLLDELDCQACGYAKEVLEKGFCFHSCEDYYRLEDEIEVELTELERLAEIGRAFEKALKEEYGFINFTRYAGAVPEKWEMKESEYNDVLDWAKASSKNNAI